MPLVGKNLNRLTFYFHLLRYDLVRFSDLPHSKKKILKLLLKFNAKIYFKGNL